MSINFAIVLATYYRSDKSSFQKVKRCIESIQKQTYKKWVLFLTGDGYSNSDEFNDLVKLLGENGNCINLKVGAERKLFEEGQIGKHHLWCCGGVNAMNVSLKRARENNFIYTCHIDDDDIWLPNHLQTLYEGYMNFPEAVYIYTKAQWGHCVGYPTNTPQLQYNNLPPTGGQVVHASTSWRLDKIPFYYHTGEEYASKKVTEPADALMWKNIVKYCKEHNHKTLFIPKTTIVKM